MVEHTITWALAVVTGLVFIISTICAIYAMFRYGAARARIDSLTEQLTECRAYVADLRQRLANHKE